jgi:hypothetical protein
MARFPRAVAGPKYSCIETSCVLFVAEMTVFPWQLAAGNDSHGCSGNALWIIFSTPVLSIISDYSDV